MTNEACFKCQRSLLHLQLKPTSFFELKKTNKKAYQSKGLIRINMIIQYKLITETLL